MRHTEFKDTLIAALDSNGATLIPGMKKVGSDFNILEALCSASSGGGMLTAYKLRMSESGGVAYYPKVLINTKGMGSSFDGSGLVICRFPNAAIFTFEMCEHEWDESGANHSRGWHPARCKKCGFDASIDSGD